MFDSITKGINADLAVGQLKSIHDSFKGNSAYESLLSDFKNLDWESADFDQVEKVAKRVTKKAAGEGLKVGAKFLGEAMVEWGATIGLASGNPVTGGLVSAIGAALEWGTDMLYDRLWPEVKVYKPGDIVLVNKTHVAIPDKEGLRRRRLPGEVMTTGIVLSAEVGGKQEIFDFQTSTNSWVEKADIKQYPPEKVNAMRNQSSALRNMQDSIKLLSEGQYDEPVPHHTVRKGDYLIHNDEMKEIEDTGEGHLLLSGFDGSTAVVNVGNKGLRDTWQSSSPEVAGGELVWCPGRGGDYYELSIVTAVLRNDKVRVVSMVTGKEGDFKFWQCVREQWLAAMNFGTFSVAAMRGDRDAYLDALPYKDEKLQDQLITEFPQGERLALLPEREIYTDDVQLDGFVPQPYYEDVFDQGPEAKSGSGMTLVLLGAAGVLAYLLST